MAHRETIILGKFKRPSSGYKMGRRRSGNANEYRIRYKVLRGGRYAILRRTDYTTTFATISQPQWLQLAMAATEQAACDLADELINASKYRVTQYCAPNRIPEGEPEPL